MQCPKCAFDVGTSKFCPQCGKGLDVAFSSKRPRALWLLVPAILLVSAAVLYATGTLRLRGDDGDPSLRIGGSAQDVALRQSGDNKPPTLALQGDTAPPSVNQTGITMPDDVRKWLEHLKRIDKQREGFNSTFAMKLIGKIGSLQPGTYFEEDPARADEAHRRGEASGIVGDVDTFFSNLATDFQSLPPPAECGPIASQYASVLLETRAMLGQISTAMTNLDTRALEAMQGTTFQRLDTKAEDTNDKIEAICKKYHEPNKYEVFVDKSSAIGIGSALTDAGPSLGMDQKAFLKLAEELMNEGIGK